jgi:hypothetical protein
MSKRDWRIIATLIGSIALIGADNPPESASQKKQAAEQHEIATSLKEISETLKSVAEPDEATKPCEANRPNRNSDLCAQWKAADAAKEAADASWHQVYIGILTLIAASMAAYYAKRAAEETQRGALAAVRTAETAHQANILSENGYKIQTRAYVNISGYEIKPKRNEAQDITSYEIVYTWKNFGVSPARNVVLKLYTSYWHHYVLPPWFPFPELPEFFIQTTQPECTIPPGGELTAIIIDIPLTDFEAVRQFWKNIFWWGELQYEDIFNNSYRQRYRRKLHEITFDEKGVWTTVKFGRIGKDTGGNEDEDAKEESFPPIPDGHRQLIANHGELGWYLWITRQWPTNWQVCGDGTPVEQDTLYRLKPPEDL